MGYYRHWIDRRTGSGSIGSLGFVFSEKDADEVIKELNSERSKYCDGYSSAEREMIWHTPVFTHEISKIDFDNRKQYSFPIRECIYKPC